MNNNNSGLYKFHSGSTTSRSTSTTRSSRSTTTRSSRTKSSRRSSRSSSNKSATSYFDTDEMDYTCTTTGNTNSTKEAANYRLLEESQAIRNFAKNIGAICVVLVVAVFGFDLAVLEEFATVLAYNVVAAAILISGVNLATLLYETMATPVPGTSDEGEAPPLQGLVRRQSSQRSSSGLVFRRTSKRPPSVSAPTSSLSSLSPQKRGSGGLFSGLWPRSKRSSKNQGEADNSSSAHQQQQQQSRSKSMQPTTKRSKKLSFGRRRGWPSGRLSAGSI